MVKVAETKVYRGKKTSVPPAVMEALNLKVGDTVEWHVESEKIIVKKKSLS